MSDNKVSKDKLAEKFEFFFIGLIFAVLGISIQTVNFSESSDIVILVEVASWLCFLISGLIGLNKLEWLPNLIYLRDRVQNRKNILGKLNIMSKTSSQILIAESNEYMAIKDLMDESETLREKYNDELKKLAEKHGIKNKVQRWSFYIGFLLLAISRSYDHIIRIL
jgi:hypothetical protein